MSQQQPADRPDFRPRSTPSPSRAPDNSLGLTLPRYKVVLLSDPAAELMFVVRSVMELTRFPRAEATHKMWEAHHSGRSVLLLTYRERAELYVEQFADRGLTVTLEPA